MTRYVGLLRGINVGGRRRVGMAELRNLVAALGHSEVITYIQSGNVVLTPAAGQSPEQVANGIEAAILERLALAVPMVVVTAEHLARIVDNNPWPDEADPKHVHVAFSAHPLTSTQAAAIAEAEARARDKGSADEARVIDGTLYLRTPDGLGRSELAIQLARLEKQPASAAVTMRNWATVRKLLELAVGATG